MKLSGLIILLFLSGCGGMDYVSGLSFVKEVITTPQPHQKSTVVIDDALEEEKFYDSSHNWNNTEKKTEVKPVVKTEEKINTRPKKKVEEKKTTLPWPLILIAALSGGLYIINRFVQYRQNRKEL